MQDYLDIGGIECDIIKLFRVERAKRDCRQDKPNICRQMTVAGINSVTGMSRLLPDIDAGCFMAQIALLSMFHQVRLADPGSVVAFLGRRHVRCRESHEETSGCGRLGPRLLGQCCCAIVEQ